MALTMFGVRAGFACNINATVPATTGEAMLVPVRLKYGLLPHGSVPFRRYAAFVTYIVLVGSDNETMPVPGATTSGFASKSIAAGPRELYPAITSSVRMTVPSWLYAPTVRTQGALPGAVMPPYWS